MTEGALENVIERLLAAEKVVEQARVVVALVQHATKKGNAEQRRAAKMMLSIMDPIVTALAEVEIPGSEDTTVH